MKPAPLAVIALAVSLSSPARADPPAQMRSPNLAAAGVLVAFAGVGLVAGGMVPMEENHCSSAGGCTRAFGGLLVGAGVLHLVIGAGLLYGGLRPPARPRVGVMFGPRALAVTGSF